MHSLQTTPPGRFKQSLLLTRPMQLIQLNYAQRRNDMAPMSKDPVLVCITAECDLKLQR